MLNRNAKHRRVIPWVGLAGLLALTSGCATKGFVRQQMSSLEKSVDTKMEPTAEQARAAQALAQDVDGRSRQVQREAQLARDLALGNIKREEVRHISVSFAFNSAEIPAETLPQLDQVAADLQSHPNYMALVAGYTDATGNEDYNVGLAQRRAGNVQRYLAEKLGIEFVRLAVIGFGESLPLADNATREGRAQNRRTDVQLVQPQPATTLGGEAPTASR